MASTAEKTVKRIVRTRGALAALVTALGLAAYYIVTQTLSWVATNTFFNAGPKIWDNYGRWFAADAITVVAFAVGYFFCLWAIAPISERLGLGHVITRSVLGVGVGATVWFIVAVLIGLTSTVGFSGSLVGYAFPSLTNLAGVPFVLSQSLYASIQLVLSLLAPGVLGGILLWRWRTAHPPEYHVEGLVDV